MSRPVLVRNQTTGRILPCCWDDCERHGDDRIKVVRAEGAPGDTTTYIFCSGRHRSMWETAHRGYGNVDQTDPGRMKRGPLGLYVPN